MISPKAIIKLDNLKNNIKYLKSISNESTLMPVVKADAYGHGMIEISRELYNSGINCVCVATIVEAVELLNAKIGLDILHLGKMCYDSFLEYSNKHIILTINSIEDVNQINLYAKNNNQKFRCHIKIDTGMNRMGCKPNEFKYIYNAVTNSDSILLEAIYSHLSCNDDETSNHNVFQLKIFEEIVSLVKNNNIKFHLLSSGGLFNYNNYCYDLVRLGISIYGVSPLKKINHNLKPVMELKAPVVLLKKILRGEKVGYGCTYIADSDMEIAIVQLGYADGLNKNFEIDGTVFIKDKEYPIVGRISMDLFAINCCNDSLKISDEVTIWGGDCLDSRLENISTKHNLLPYVYLTNLSQRVQRIYV